MNILVSACLLGENCKYSGGNNLAEGLETFLTEHGCTVVPFCPEQAGGLPTPRVPAERLGDCVFNKQGEDVTEQFLRGARLALEAARKHGCTAAVLKKNSPSCGCGSIYDGTFTGTLTEGDGMTAELLKEWGIAIYNEENYQAVLTDITEELPWVVTYSDGIWDDAPDGDDVGEELTLDTAFLWAERDWRIPAVYVCREGLVMDVCQRADREALQAFIDKWNLLENDGRDVFTEEQEEQINRENPLGFGYDAHIIVNGTDIRQKSASGITWNPCILDFYRDIAVQKRLLRHYGLDADSGWSIRRICFPWENREVPQIETLSVTLTAGKADYTAGCFTAAAGEELCVTHPVTGEVFTLSVCEVEQHRLDLKNPPEDDMVYPQCYTSMTYEVSPPVDKRRMQLRDVCRGDSPIRRGSANGQIGCGVSAIALLREDSAQHTALSSLTFAPQETVEWRVVFHEKEYADVIVLLID